MGGKSAFKTAYCEKLKSLLDEYKTVFIVGIDNVSSQQMHEIRLSLRGEGVVLMGKNTMVSLRLNSFALEWLLTVISGSPCHQGLRCREPGVRASASLR